MLRYLCMIYDHTDQVLTVESMAAPDDESAIEEASDITGKYPGCRGFVLWKDGEKVSSNLQSRRQS